jgi:hypothetical protein
MVDFRKHKTCIFGIQGSGKTYFAQNICQQFKRPIVLVLNDDDLKDWMKVPRLYVYKINKRLDSREEFKSKFMPLVYKNAQKGKIDAVFIDEADMFFNNNYDLSPEINDLVMNHRHIGDGVALILMTRRPQDIPTKIVETSKHLVIFKLEGANAIRRFGEIHPEIPDLVKDLNYEKHNFIYKSIGKRPVIHQAIYD